MDIQTSLALLKSKDTPKAYQALQELEILSDTSNVLYKHINEFIQMISSEKYVERVRGFRLIAKQAQWDTNNIIDSNIEQIISILKDDKPTAVRQALSYLKEIVLYKPNLHQTIKEHILGIDYFRYKDTMHSLIEKDIQELLALMNNNA